MPRKKEKKRRLWLNVTQKGVKVTKRKFIKRLLRSIEDGTYRLPKKWKVKILWKNKEDAPWRGRDSDWQTEMENSAESSPGWDIAVTTYLKRKLR